MNLQQSINHHQDFDLYNSQYLGYDQMTTQQFSPLSFNKQGYFINSQNHSQNFLCLNSSSNSPLAFNPYKQSSDKSIKQIILSGQNYQQTTHCSNISLQRRSSGEANNMDIFFQDTCQFNNNNINQNTQIQELQSLQNSINLQQQQQKQNIQMIQQQFQLQQQQQQQQQQYIQLQQFQQLQNLYQIQQQQQFYQQQQVYNQNAYMQQQPCENTNNNEDQQNNTDFDIVSLCNFEDRNQDEIFLMNYSNENNQSQEEILQKIKEIEENLNKKKSSKQIKNKLIQLQENQLSILHDYHSMDTTSQNNLKNTHLPNRLAYCEKRSKQLGEDYKNFEENYEENKKPQKKCKNKYNTKYQCKNCKMIIPKALIYFHCKFFHEYTLPKIQEEQYIQKGLQKYEKIQKKVKTEPQSYNENTFLQIVAVKKAFSQKEEEKMKQNFKKFESNFMKKNLILNDFKSKNKEQGKSFGTTFSDEILKDLMQVITSPQNNLNVKSLEEQQEDIKREIKQNLFSKDTKMDLIAQKSCIQLSKIICEKVFQQSIMCLKKVNQILQKVQKVNQNIIKKINNYIKQYQNENNNQIQQPNQEQQKTELQILSNIEKCIVCMI